MGLANTSQGGQEIRRGAGGVLGGGLWRDTGPLAREEGGGLHEC